MEAICDSQNLMLITEAKSLLRKVLHRCWENEDGAEDADGGVLACPFCGGTKIRLKKSEEDAVYTVRISCAGKLCGAGLQGEPQPSEQRARNNAISRWNNRQ